MKSSRHIFRPFLRYGILGMLWAYLARAYLEPGTSSFFLKIFISALAGFVFVFRYIWLALRSLFSKPTPPKTSEKQKQEDKKK